MGEWRKSVSINPAPASPDEYKPGDRRPRITMLRTHVAVTFTTVIDVPVSEMSDLYFRPTGDQIGNEAQIERIKSEVRSWPVIMEVGR